VIYIGLYTHQMFFGVGGCLINIDRYSSICEFTNRDLLRYGGIFKQL